LAKAQLEQGKHEEAGATAKRGQAKEGGKENKDLKRIIRQVAEQKKQKKQKKDGTGGASVDGAIPGAVVVYSAHTVYTSTHTVYIRRSRDVPRDGAAGACVDDQPSGDGAGTKAGVV
jgi:hypothetical protein